ncbi:oligosaccharide flippase family protein [Aureivirga marina]|uniref:oligosaccharide flippase family protein n=1 Tax=Aureivirga marina TaxID=1182451 RepID=UPI0018CAC6F2
MSLVSIKGMDFLIPLIIFPFLLKVLGFDKFGLISFSLSVCAYFGALIQYGFSITAVRDIARIKTDLKLLNQKFNDFFWTSISLLVISFSILLLLIFIVPKFSGEAELYFYTFFLVGMQSVFPYWFFQGVEEMKLIAYINVLTKFLYLVSLFIFINEPSDYVYVYLLYALNVLVGNIISIIIIRKRFNVSLTVPNFYRIKNVILSGRHAFITQFAPNFYNNTATFVLGLTVSSSILGIYVSATKVIDALNSLAVLISSTFLPYLSRNIENHVLYKRIMYFVGISVCCVAFIFSTQIIDIFVDENIKDINLYFKWLILMVVFIFFRLIYGPNFLMLIGKEKLYKNIVLYSSLFFFFFSMYIIPKMGVFGAISVMIGASGTMSILTYLAYKKVVVNG